MHLKVDSCDFVFIHVCVILLLFFKKKKKGKPDFPHYVRFRGHLNLI